MEKKKIRFGVHIFTFLIAFVVVLSTIPIEKAEAYVTTGNRLNRDQTLLFIPSSEFGTTTIAHFNEALWQWNSASKYTLMRRDPTVRHSTTNYSTRDSNNRIYKINIGNGYLAQTTWYTTGNTLVEADINFNIYYGFANSAVSGCYDVWSVMVHEAGHAAGFDHSFFTASVMWYQSTSNSTAKRTLITDDILGAYNYYK